MGNAGIILLLFQARIKIEFLENVKNLRNYFYLFDFSSFINCIQRRRKEPADNQVERQQYWDRIMDGSADFAQHKIPQVNIDFQQLIREKGAQPGQCDNSA